MYHLKKSLLLIFVLLLQACNTSNQALQATQTSPPLLPISATATTPFTATVPPPPTETPTLPPTVTHTLVPVTPTVDSLVATNVAMVGSMGAIMNISEYFNPTGTPLKTWQEVPIMPEATAGQEYPPYIYSYTAKATLSQAQQFYSRLASSLGIQNLPATGFAGTGSNANHSVDFFSYKLTIVLTSFDNDSGHVIVVISKTG